MLVSRLLKIMLSASLAGAALGAVGVSAASAAPEWEFKGTELLGTETVRGVAGSDSIAIPGATTTCTRTLLSVKISNREGVGQGEVTEVVESGCTATASCKVKSIEAKKLPWPLHATTIAGKTYVVLEKVKIDIEYEGMLCPLEGAVRVSGSAGGLWENATSTLTFDKASFEATKTALNVGASAVEWAAIFPFEALGAHVGEALELS